LQVTGCLPCQPGARTQPSGSRVQARISVSTPRPRSLLSPFTDNADLTPADQRAYTSYAKTERHKTFENIDVSFGEPPHPRNHTPERHPSGR